MEKMAINLILAIIASYLIGAFSPGYIFGRLVKGIDIRKFGNRNTGATNTFKIIGPFWGILGGIIDISKGFFAFIVSLYFLGMADIALLVSLAVILGHNYPFYLKFRGGKGVASSLGLVAGSLFYTQSIFAAIIASFLLVRAIIISKKLKVIKPARKIYRMSGFIIPVWYWTFGQEPAFKLVLALLVFFALLDLLRLIIPRFNLIVFQKLKSFLKPKEERFVSTTTYFLVSSVLVVYYFPLPIAVLSLSFFLIGDTIAEIFGSVFRKLLIGRKSIEGSAFGFLFCALVGVYLAGPLGVGVAFAIKGAFYASLVEFLSQRVDDNLTIPIGTAILLHLF